MGTDIHMFVEKQNTKTKEWELITQKGELDWLYWGRNYDLFAILADVRNDKNLPGVVTGDGFTPIASPKGMPSDASEMYRQLREDWEGVGHSDSFFTVSELIAFEWQAQKTIKRSYFNEEDYRIYLQQGSVESIKDKTIGGVGGSRIEVLNHRDMKSLISGKLERKKTSRYYAIIEWESTYKDTVPDLFNSVLPKLEELANGETDKVRIVFFFDN